MRVCHQIISGPLGPSCVQLTLSVDISLALFHSLLLVHNSSSSLYVISSSFQCFVHITSHRYRLTILKTATHHCNRSQREVAFLALCGGSGKQHVRGAASSRSAEETVGSALRAPDDHHASMDAASPPVPIGANRRVEQGLVDMRYAGPPWIQSKKRSRAFSFQG